MTGELSVWMYGERVATVDRDRRSRLGLRYTERATGLFPPGTPLLSIRLPVSSERYTHGTVAPFLEGFLPEGDVRRVIAQRVGVAETDTFGLLRALGRDCAGALVILPEDEPLPLAATPEPEKLTAEELEVLIGNLSTTPLGVDGDVRLSLAGVQEKLVLTRTHDGNWARPVRGLPSTHILKPEIPEYGNTVENEAFCMRLAKHLGLEAAEVDVEGIGRRRVLVVERFDRLVKADGAIERIHQEDFCQALGVLPVNKYESQGGPTFRRIASILATAAEPGSLERLFKMAVIQVLLGNCDAHGKNYSLVHERAGTLRLAPLYDLLSTRIYPALSAHLSMYVDGVQRLDAVTGERLVNEAVRWGIQRSRAESIAADLIGRVPLAMERATTEIPAVPSVLKRFIEQQLQRLRTTMRSGNT